MTSIFEGINPPKEGQNSNQSKGPHERVPGTVYKPSVPPVRFIRSQCNPKPSLKNSHVEDSNINEKRQGVGRSLDDVNGNASRLCKCTKLVLNLPSLKLTVKAPVRGTLPKRKLDHLPTIHFQVLCLSQGVY